MTQYTDYNYYINEYKGTMPYDYFENIVIRASAEVRKYISDKDITEYKDDVQLATCSVADVLYEIEQKEQRKSKLISSKNEDRVLASESVGDYSRTFANTTNIKDLDEEISNQKAKIHDEIRTYLLHTGLLYRGG